MDVARFLQAMKETELPPGRNYRKLSHLNRAEKDLRRKFMNKKNSQLSRGRKRGQVQELNDTVQRTEK